MREVEVSFCNTRGVKLVGTLALTDAPGPVVLCCQGLSGNRKVVFPDIAAHFASRGISSLRFDYSGYGDSEGERGWIDPRARVDDALSALAFLIDREGLKSHGIGVYGHSYGGAVAIHVAARDQRVGAAVSISGPGDGVAMLRAYRPAWEWIALRNGLDQERAAIAGGADPTVVPILDIFKLSPEFEAEYRKLVASQGGTSAQVAGSGLGVSECYLASADAICDFHPQVAAANLTHAPLLLVSGTDDAAVPVETVEPVYQAAPGPKRWILIPNANHNTLDSEPGLGVAASHAADWFTKYLTAQ